MRDLEDKLAKLSKENKEVAHVGEVVRWETRTSEKIKNSTIQQRYDALQTRRLADLESRRQRLADKLAHEEDMYKQQLLSAQVTPEQRRAQLAARARALAASREAERQSLASSLMEQAFRERCDVLRDTNSKRILYSTLDERNAQIEQRMSSKIYEAEERRAFAEMNEQERVNKEQRHLDDLMRDKQLRRETVKVLDEQVKAVAVKRAGEATAKAVEAAELMALWAKIAQEQKDEDAADRARMKALAAELLEFNRLKQMQISEGERHAREMDLRTLQVSLSKEAEDESRDGEKREAQREDAKRYRAQLALMMHQDAEDQAQRDGMIFAEFQDQQAKRDAELAARDEARRQLMREVDVIRQQQIKYKLDRRHQDARDVEAERAAIEADERVAAAEAHTKALATRKKSLMTRLEFQTQMISKAHMAAAEQDEKLRVQERSSEVEAEYMARVKDSLQNTQPVAWHGRRKFTWDS
ncbi:MAG: hypothetical protein WDW38_008607 [Sanguina aurantia]